MRGRASFFRGLIAVGLLVGPAGCTTEQQGGSNVTYAPPGWMAQEAQSTEAYNAAMSRCMAEAGYPVDIRPDGGADTSDYITGDSDEATVLKFNKVTSDCIEAAREEIGPQAELTDSEQYARMMQTYECLEAQGYDDLGDPPSEQGWVEQIKKGGEGNVWSPYGQLYAKNPTISEQDWFALKKVCVEGGIVYSADFSGPPGS